MKKDNNTRKFPLAKSQPRHTYADKIGRTQARKELADARTLEEKIARLPPEPASKKERTRLLTLLAKQNQVKVEAAPTPQVKTETVSKEDRKQAKRYMQGS